MDTTQQILLQADAARLPLADDSVDLVFTSPPYIDARLYLEKGTNKRISRGCAEWVDWMLTVVTEACRVSRGLVLVNCAGVTRGRIYQPGPEGLLYEWWKRGGVAWRPAYWHRVGIPGSGGKHWLRADIEYVLCFKRTKEWPAFSDNTACGHPPKWGPGGEMSHRLSDGKRVNQWGPVGSAKGFGNRFKHGDALEGSKARPSHFEPKPMYRRGQNGDRQNDVAFARQHTKSLADGTDEVQTYYPPVLANPGNLLKTKVGGGALGSQLSHENEAPFPEKLAEFFIKTCCPVGGWVLDNFGGSGTTAATARRLGRNAISSDIRMSQCDLMRRRLAEPPRVEKKRRAPKPLGFGEGLFGALEIAS